MLFVSSPSLPRPKSLHDPFPSSLPSSPDTNYLSLPNSRSIKNIPPSPKLHRPEQTHPNGLTPDPRRPPNATTPHLKPPSHQSGANGTATALPTALNKSSPCETPSPHHLAIQPEPLNHPFSRRPTDLLSKRSEFSAPTPPEPSPVSPHPSVQMHSQAFDKPKYDSLTPNSRSLRPDLDQFHNLALPAPRPRPRHSLTAPLANRYTSYVPSTRLSSYMDESRLVTGILESALPPSARPQAPSPPARTMSITQLDQRHRLALQRLQKPASALIACQSNQDSAPPLPAAKPVRARQTHRKPSTPSPPGDGVGNAEGKLRKSVAYAGHPNDDCPRQPALDSHDVSAPAKEKVKPKRWKIFRFLGARGASSHSPPKPSRATTTEKQANRAHVAARVPVRILSGETSSEQVDDMIHSDSDSDIIPLAQLRPQLIMRASASSGTCSTFNSRALPVTRKHSSNSLQPTARSRNAPVSSLASHRISMMSSSVHHHSKKPRSSAIGGQDQARPVILLPGESVRGSMNSAHKRANRSSAWLDY